MAADEHREGGSAVVGARHRLATYGTLAPGRPNHHQLDALDGHWLEGHVYGRLIEAGWGASLGYPALILDQDGSAISVQVRTFRASVDDLPAGTRQEVRRRDPRRRRMLRRLSN